MIFCLKVKEENFQSTPVNDVNLQQAHQQQDTQQHQPPAPQHQDAQQPQAPPEPRQRIQPPVQHP